MLRLFAGILSILLFVTSGLVLGVVQKNRSLVEAARSASVVPPEPHKRLFVPPIHVSTLADDSILLGHGMEDMQQILLVFKTSCPDCTETLPAWAKLQQSTRSWEAVTYVGISLDSARVTRAYAADNEMDFPIVSLTGEKNQSLYGLERVPHTLVIGDNGRVLYSRIGAIFEQATIDSILIAAFPS